MELDATATVSQGTGFANRLWPYHRWHSARWRCLLILCYMDRSHDSGPQFRAQPVSKPCVHLIGSTRLAWLALRKRFFSELLLAQQSNHIPGPVNRTQSSGNEHLTNWTFSFVSSPLHRSKSRFFGQAVRGAQGAPPQDPHEFHRLMRRDRQVLHPRLFNDNRCA